MARRKGSTAKAKTPVKHVEQDLDTIHARLCNEYPDVDSSLIYALLLDIEDPSRESLKTLGQNLEKLAVDAKTDDPSAHQRNQSNSPDYTDEPDTSCFSDSLFPESTATGSSSPYSDLDAKPGMEFLLSIFTQSSPATLQRVLEDYGDEDSGEIDMEKVIEEIMSLELVRELEERGLDDVDKAVDEERKRDWSVVEKQKLPKRTKARSGSASVTSPPARISAPAPRTFVLSDVRQQANRQSARPPGLGIRTQDTVNDPWTKVASLSTRLAQLLPPLTASHFSSLLHNPAFKSPAEAIRRELARIGSQDKDPPGGKFNTALVGFLELLQCQDDAEVRDATTCLRAAKLAVESALDLVYLLQELDRADPIVLRSPRASSPISTQASSSNDLAKAIITPLPLSPVASLRSSSFGSWTLPTSPTPRSTNDDWTKVSHERKRNASKDFEVDPLAAFIPAYAGRPAGWRQEGGRAAWEPDLNDETSEKECREMAAYYRRRREESLREATKYWRGNGGGRRGGGSVGRGGDVALYYAEESRDYDRQSREWSMKAAKAMVNSRRVNGKDPNSVDLHGTNTQEALAIAREAVRDWWSTYGSEDGRTAKKSFSIITGRGNHSRGGVGVIGPAVKNFLEGEGWRFTQRPGTFVVTGSMRKRSQTLY
ncbi:hypothetical protein FRC04_011600 [Tulasnella sp. 424]|nr:hypothetical protein FRC04_011600 [Tulasnella sp. 424]KAG8967182.1 hypothetical protein FRC05_002257 [Tulasnella sp. 425]